MSSYNSVLNGAKRDFSNGSASQLRPAFGQSGNCFRYEPGGFSGGVAVPAFGQSSDQGYLFGYSYPSVCNGGYGCHNCDPFGIIPSNGSTFAPALGRYSHPFGFGFSDLGTSLPTFGQNSSSPFGSALANGGTSMPTFGQTSAAFGSPVANGGTFMSTSGQNSATFGFPLANGGTSIPTFGQNSAAFGFAPANGGTSIPTIRQIHNPFFCAPANAGTAVPAFGRSTNSFGFTPSNTATSLPARRRSYPSGPVITSGGTPATTFGVGTSHLPPAPTDGTTFVSAPTNGATSVPACGAPSYSTSTQAALSSPICGPLSGSTSSLQTPAVNSSSSRGFDFGCSTLCSQPTLPSCTSNLFVTDPYLLGSRNHLSGSTTHFQTPTINASSSPGVSFACTTYGQTTTQFGTISNLNETSSCSDEIQSPYRCQVETPLFRDSSSRPLNLKGNCVGSRVTPYTETVEPAEPGSQQSMRFMSISAMPVFRDKCHEELRWEDKQLVDNGKIPLFHSVRSGRLAIRTRKGSNVMPYSKTLLTDSSTAISISAMPVYLNKSFEELRWEDYQFNNAGGRVDNGLAQLNNFRSNVSGTDSLFRNAMPSVPPYISAFRPTCCTFPTYSTPFFSNPFLNDLHEEAYTSVTQPPSIFGPTLSFSHPNPSLISTSASKASTSGPSYFNYTSSAPSTSICSTSVTTPVTAAAPCNNIPPIISTFNDLSLSRCRAETPPAVAQMSVEGPKTTSVRYGIYSVPVNHSANEEKKLLLPPKCNRDDNGPKVAFSTDTQKTPTASTKVPLLLKDDSGILISGPSEEGVIKIDFENISNLKHTSIHVYENGKVSVELSKPLADGFIYQDKAGNPGEAFAAGHSLGINSVSDHPSEKEGSSNVYGLMPKLKHSDYFIEPRVEELAIKESIEPGFCSHVKDFVVGHQHYGRIKFLGETDVRQLDVNSHIVFRNREVIILMDENKKLPVGQGLNQPAEITLCNIKCFDKAGNQHINGPKVDKYREELMKRAAEQGAEFVSYDPVQGEWKFKVKHF